MKGNIYTIVYAAVLGTTCAMVLTFAASFTASYQEANRKAEEVKNILLALNISMPDKASSEQLVEIYKDNVEDDEDDKEQGDITTYVSNNDGAIAIRFVGPGLWGPIKGFLALDPKMTKIRGITFYEQEETPGLGGDIVNASFRDKFVGLMIRDKAGNPGIIIKNGGEAAINKVDGISGATMTCDKVQEMLNEAIKSIVEEKQ
ncbi:MAG: FMN-binding protein [Planctomycetota bacterium]|jgi:Na+-transporting NADH:ubiquinone oxidoreductase subunit C